jgi:hypothetical protein
MFRKVFLTYRAGGRGPSSVSCRGLFARGVLTKWGAVVLTAGLAGCGPSGPPTQAVSGVVTLDGKPVSGATVTFSPSAAGGAFASGLTNAEGRFSLNAALAGAKAGAGTLPGDYLVSISKIESSEAARPDDPNAPGYDPLASVSSRPAPPKYLVPKAYGEPATSGLTATVGPGGGSFEFQLQSDFKGR